MSSTSVPGIVLEGDTARARRSDPPASHVAADVSARNRGRVHDAVVELLTEHGPMTGRDINDQYEMHRWSNGWPRVAADSPRKRAAELVGTRLTILNPRDPRGTPAIYAIREDA